LFEKARVVGALGWSRWILGRFLAEETGGCEGVRECGNAEVELGRVRGGVRVRAGTGMARDAVETRNSSLRECLDCRPKIVRLAWTPSKRLHLLRMGGGRRTK
jgi:hypothetical protein